jgi:hypothetical protein
MDRRRRPPSGIPEELRRNPHVADLIYVAVTIVAFAILALVVWGVERL